MLWCVEFTSRDGKTYYQSYNKNRLILTMDKNQRAFIHVREVPSVIQFGLCYNYIVNVEAGEKCDDEV